MNLANQVVLDSNLPNLSRRFISAPPTVEQKRVLKLVGDMTNNNILEVKYHETIRELAVTLGDTAEDVTAAIAAMPALAIASDLFADAEKHKADAFFSCAWAGHATLIVGENATKRSVEKWFKQLPQDQQVIHSYNAQRGIEHANKSTGELSLVIQATQVVKECLRDVDSGKLKFVASSTTVNSDATPTIEDRFLDRDRDIGGQTIFTGDIQPSDLGNMA